MPRPVVAKNPWGRPINHRTPTAPKGQNEIAQGRAKRRPGYGKRDGSIGSLTLSEPFGQNLGGFRGRQARNKQDLLGHWDETRTHLESTRKSGPFDEKMPIRPV